MKMAFVLIIWVPLMALESPTQKQVMAAAWKLLPQQMLLEQQKAALSNKVNPWFFDMPEVSLDYQAEGSSDLQSEWEFGLDLPIALPEFKRLQEKLQNGYQDIYERERYFLKWHLSGRLQSMWWDLQLLQVKKRQSEVSLLDSGQQRAWLHELVELGERSQDELNQTQQQWVLDQFQYQEAQQNLAAMKRNWFQVTGMNELPEQWILPDEKKSPQVLNENTHPYLNWIKQQIINEENQLQHSKGLDRAPSLRMGLKKVESLNEVPGSTAWKIGVSIPLKNRNTGAYRESYRALGQTRSHYREVKMDVELQINQLRAAMDSNQLQLDLLDPMVSDMEKQFEMRKVAYRQEFISALEWQQIRQLYRRFRQQYGEAVIRQKSLQSKYYHALGVMP